jgi:hypothetical protein
MTIESDNKKAILCDKEVNILPEYTLKNLVELNEKLSWVPMHPTKAFSLQSSQDIEDSRKRFSKEKKYHPVSFSLQGLRAMKMYYLEKNNAYLQMAEAYAEMLLNGANKSSTHNTIYFPYNFEFKAGSISLMRPPWYSGMAQSYSLALFTSLFQAGKKKYKEKASMVFNSLCDISTSHVDDLGFYWIDEYPDDFPRMRVLNGFLWAIFGIYEYCFEVAKSEGDKPFVAYVAALATIKKYALKWRRGPSLRSSYCLKYPKKAGAKKYHDMHIRQFQLLNEITGDDFFSEMSLLYASDYS